MSRLLKQVTNFKIKNPNHTIRTKRRHPPLIPHIGGGLALYNKQGNAITMEEWPELLRDENYKIVAQTNVADGIFVSTVWLGLDHNFRGGRPLIFETMAFSREGESMYCERYSTLAQAEKGHRRLLRQIERRLREGQSSLFD